jgi:hypothetical protein
MILLFIYYSLFRGLMMDGLLVAYIIAKIPAALAGIYLFLI